MNQLLTLLRDSRERRFKSLQREAEERHKLELQANEREHQGLLRAEEAHSDAREETLPAAIAVNDWFEELFIDEHGLDYDFMAIQRSRPEESLTPAQVLARLRGIAQRHPSKSVREAAHSLFNSVDNAYNDISGGGPVDPSDTLVSSWMHQSSDLIEKIHQFEAASPVVQPADDVSN
ncbi:hypothetical protein [Actinomycetospora chlora]|uniref:hypothetical protein n=1 Tax=Actinomycetospora chlora TaxID=663608 RepID=UPI0031F025B4